MTNRKAVKIAIASGKGGTGKTMLAVNMASLLSYSGKTLLTDLDVEEPNDSLFFGGTKSPASARYRLIPEWDEERCVICDLCSSVCKFHAAVRLGDTIAIFNKLCHSCHACSELCPQQALPMRKHMIGEINEIRTGNLTLLEGRLNTGEEQGVPLIDQTHEMAEKEYLDYDIKIFDCPPGNSCPVIAAVKRCDYVILVTEPTPFGLNDLKLAVATMRQLRKPTGVVINRDGIGNDEVESFCRAENIDILARIPYDREIARLYSEGDLVYKEICYMKPLLKELCENVLQKTGKI